MSHPVARQSGGHRPITRSSDAKHESKSAPYASTVTPASTFPRQVSVLPAKPVDKPLAYQSSLTPPREMTPSLGDDRKASEIGGLRAGRKRGREVGEHADASGLTAKLAELDLSKGSQPDVDSKAAEGHRTKLSKGDKPLQQARAALVDTLQRNMRQSSTERENLMGPEKYSRWDSEAESAHLAAVTRAGCKAVTAAYDQLQAGPAQGDLLADLIALGRDEFWQPYQCWAVGEALAQAFLGDAPQPEALRCLLDGIGPDTMAVPNTSGLLRGIATHLHNQPLSSACLRVLQDLVERPHWAGDPKGVCDLVDRIAGGRSSSHAVPAIAKAFCESAVAIHAKNPADRHGHNILAGLKTTAVKAPDDLLRYLLAAPGLTQPAMDDLAMVVRNLCFDIVQFMSDGTPELKAMLSACRNAPSSNAVVTPRLRARVMAALALEEVVKPFVAALARAFSFWVSGLTTAQVREAAEGLGQFLRERVPEAQRADIHSAVLQQFAQGKWHQDDRLGEAAWALHKALSAPKQSTFRDFLAQLDERTPDLDLEDRICLFTRMFRAAGTLPPAGPDDRRDTLLLSLAERLPQYSEPLALGALVGAFLGLRYHQSEEGQRLRLTQHMNEVADRMKLPARDRALMATAFTLADDPLTALSSTGLSEHDATELAVAGLRCADRFDTAQGVRAVLEAALALVNQPHAQIWLIEEVTYRATRFVDAGQFKQMHTTLLGLLARAMDAAGSQAVPSTTGPLPTTSRVEKALGDLYGKFASTGVLAGPDGQKLLGDGRAGALAALLVAERAAIEAALPAGHSRQAALTKIEEAFLPADESDAESEDEPQVG